MSMGCQSDEDPGHSFWNGPHNWSDEDSEGLILMMGGVGRVLDLHLLGAMVRVGARLSIFTSRQPWILGTAPG
jgi:hypothetical protein